MSIQGLPPNIQGKWLSTTSGQNVLSPATKAIINSFGPGYKVVNVQKGIQADGLKNGLQVKMDLGQTEEARKILNDIAEALGIKEGLDTAVVMLGGMELVKEKMDEIKKSMKKMKNEKLAQLAEKLGLTTEEDILIYTEANSETLPGGILIIQAGMQEIEDSIQN